MVMVHFEFEFTFSVWKTGILTNEKIGRLFGMTYSSISHIVRSVRLRMEENRDLKEKFNQIYSLFKICHQLRTLGSVRGRRVTGVPTAIIDSGFDTRLLFGL